MHQLVQVGCDPRRGKPEAHQRAPDNCAGSAGAASAVHKNALSNPDELDHNPRRLANKPLLTFRIVGKASVCQIFECLVEGQVKVTGRAVTGLETDEVTKAHGAEL